MLSHHLLRCRFITTCCLVAVFAASGWSAEHSGTATMATYDQPTGETYFALSLRPPVDLVAAEGQDIVVLFDTSASQTGVHRDKALSALDGMLQNLSDSDRVQLLAVDVDPVALTQQFQGARSAEIRTAVDGLLKRLPLGSTDLIQGLMAAAAKFDPKSTTPRRVVYIGDGMSRANLLQSEEFRELSAILAARKITLCSLVIGPQRDVEMIATLANHTGGNLYLDGDGVTGQQAGLALAEMARAAVVWPTQPNYPPSFVDVVPETMPPLRTDRDTILLGTLQDRSDSKMSLQGEYNGKPVEISFALKVSPTHPDYAFVPRVVEAARQNGGLLLPTAGTEALHELARVMMSDADELGALSVSALQRGDTAAAEKLAGAALETDPLNPSASVVKTAVKRVQNGDPLRLRVAQTDPGVIGDVVIESPIVDEPAVSEGVITGDFLPGGVVSEPALGAGTNDSGITEQPDGEYLDEINALRRARENLLRVEVRTGLAAARDRMSTDPDTVIEDLKVLREGVRDASEVSPDVRTELAQQVESAIREGMRQREIVYQRQAEASARRAVAQERQRLVESINARDENVKQILDKFNALMDEGNYFMAEEAAKQAEEIDPRNIAPQVARMNARAQGYHERIMEIRDRRQQMFVETLMTVEESHIPSPDEPPLVYPDPERWRDLSKRREEYKSVDLAKRGGAEEEIARALDTTVDEFDYFQQTLPEIVEDLREKHRINIQIDDAAIEEDGAFDNSARYDMQLSGLSLRSALRLLFNKLKLTYIIENEVLLITTEAKALEKPVVKVYPVGDLVLPIQSGGLNPFSMGGGLGGSFGGGGGGGGFGGGGGGFGGGGGGFGGGGGGFGGGGGGFGGGGFGGGGFFQAADKLTLRKKSGKTPAAEPASGKSAAVAPVTRSEAARPVATPGAARIQLSTEAPVTDGESPRKAVVLDAGRSDGESVEQAWNRYFAHQVGLTEVERAASNDIQRTVHHHMNLRTTEGFQEAAAVIRAALLHGFPQPWMYEGLALALQAAGADENEIERTLMSSLDFSETPDDLYYIASYLARRGHEERALKLFRDLAMANPTRPEPLSQVLTLAERTKNDEAIRWASLEILRRAWTTEQEEIQHRAVNAATAALKKLKTEDATRADAFLKQLNDALQRDVVATVTWSGDADLDLVVQEPTETLCSLRTPRTTAGGVMLGDASSVSGPASREAISESYECPEGFAGKYQMLVRPIWGNVTAGKVNVSITLHRGTSQEQTQTQTIPIDDKPVAVTFDLDSGRRREALKDHQVAHIAQREQAVSQAVLAQQIDQLSDSEALQDLIDARIAASQFGNFGIPRFGNAVGYFPVVTPFPEGTNISATAVISADRRYVRISATPLFSGIGDVFTFNFATGQQNQTGGQ